MNDGMKNGKYTVIVCNGEIADYAFYKKYFSDPSFVIGVDGGASHLKKLGVVPDLLVGDFDSVNPEDLQFFLDKGVEVAKFPVEKDMTDTELALEIASERGMKSVIILGGIGSRMDHTLANVLLLRKAWEQGIECTVVNENNEIRLIQDKISLAAEEGYKVTLLPLDSKVYGVTTRGLYYPLENATLEMGTTWGVSNEFVEDFAEIRVESGQLIVIMARD